MWKQFIGQLLCAFTGHSWIRSSTKVQGKKVSICGRCFKARITPGSKYPMTGGRRKRTPNDREAWGHAVSGEKMCRDRDRVGAHGEFAGFGPRAAPAAPAHEDHTRVRLGGQDHVRQLGEVCSLRWAVRPAVDARRFTGHAPGPGPVFVKGQMDQITKVPRAHTGRNRSRPYSPNPRRHRRNRRPTRRPGRRRWYYSTNSSPSCALKTSVLIAGFQVV